MDYLFDSCLLIDAYDKKIPEAMERVRQVMSKEDAKFFINRLALLETLRGIKWVDTKKFQTLRDTLDIFTVVDIEQEIYDNAISFSRFCRSKGITLKGRCEAIDYLHFLTAKYYGFEILTNDADIATLTRMYPNWIDSL